jgi:hypothetical protein
MGTRVAAVLAALGAASGGIAPAMADVIPSPAVVTATVLTCGPFRLSVGGSNFDPFTAVLVTFDAGSGGTPQSFQAGTDGFGRFSLDIAPAARADGRYAVRADDFKQRESEVIVTVACAVSQAQPTLRLDPTVGRPGFVTVARGAGFRPGARVALAWDRGIPVHIPPAVADSSGVFQAPILILPHDFLGPRALSARPAGPGEAAFAVSPAGYDVVIGPLEPPRWENRG